MANIEMENDQSQGEEQPQIPITVYLQTSHFPAVFDMSLSLPFEIFIQLRRGQTSDDDERPMTILRTASAFDGAYALSTGLLQLIDLEDGIPVDMREATKSAELQASKTGNFITLQSRKRMLLPGERLRPRFDVEVDLGFPLNFKDKLKIGHRYRLKLPGPDLDIKWWAWGTPSELGITSDTTIETLGPPETGRIVCHQLTSKEFAVVEFLEVPPSLKVELAPLQNTTGNTSASGEPTTARPSIHVVITNTNSQDVTVKSTWEQQYIKPIKYTIEPESAHPRLTSRNRSPCITNFSVIDTDTNEDLMYWPIQASASLMGFNSRQNFTTLKPGVPITSQVDFPEWLAEKMRGRRCQLILRPFGSWWAWGSVDELFEQDEKPMNKILKEKKLPLILQSDDQVTFET